MKILSFFISLFFFVSPVLSQQNFHNDRLIIKIKEGVDFHLEKRQNENGISIAFTGIDDIDQLNESFNCIEIIQKFPQITEYGINRWYLFKFAKPSNFEELFSSYLSLTNYFDYVEKLSISRSSFIPNDPLLDSLNCKAYWDIHLPEAWDVETGNSGITVAVIDNGLDWKHPDIDIKNIYQNNTGGTGNYGEDADRDGHTFEMINNQIVFDSGDINGIDDDGNGKIDDFAGWNFADENNNIVPPDPNFTHGTAIPPNDYTLIGSTNRDTLSFIDEQVGIGNGQMYFYYVRAKNNSLLSSPSNSVSTRGLMIEKTSITQIDTLYYLPDTTKFAPKYAMTGEIYNPHCRFKPDSAWEFYTVKEVHFLFSHMVIRDTLKSIAFYKDTLKTKIYEQTINDILDSIDVYPNWYKVDVDTNFSPIKGVIEVPYQLISVVDLASPINILAPSGNSIGFHDGSQSWIPILDYPVKLIIKRSTTNVPPEKQNPGSFILFQNYPNPFNSSTKIGFSISNFGFTSLKVFDLLGREITTLVNEPKQPGEYEVEFDASKYGLSSGVYLYQLKSGSYTSTKKFVYLR